MTRPVSAAAKSAGPPACRRVTRGCSTCTDAIWRPTTCRSSPRRTISTSGSSGIVLTLAGLVGVRAVGTPAVPLPRVLPVPLVRWRRHGRSARRARARRLADQVPRRLGGLLLGFLLRASFALAVIATADPHRCAERLLVVRAAFLDVVLRHAEDLGSGELLKRGLPVQSGAQPG